MPEPHSDADDRAGHTHGVTADTSKGRLPVALALIVCFMAGFIGTLIGGVVIVTTGFHRADPIASLLVAALMLRAAYGVLKDSGRVLLEMAPE